MKYTIHQDGDAESPIDSMELFSTFTTWHRRYRLGHLQPEKQSPDAWRRLHSKLKCILPLYLYDHSGLAISTSPFSCPWDSGQVGWAWASAERVEREFYGNLERAMDCMRDEVKMYNQYLSGDVWHYTIEDDDGSVIDSLSGCYGRDYCEEEAQAALVALTTPEMTLTHNED